jgi:hypothetical protein
MLPRTVDSETERMLLARAVETLIMTRSNERVGQRPGQQLEDTLDGKAATDLICWEYNRGKVECGCDGERAHLEVCHLACGGAVNAALHGRHVCKRPNGGCRLAHPEPSQIRTALHSWAAARNGGREPVWASATAVNRVGNNALRGGDRSVSTSSVPTTSVSRADEGKDTVDERARGEESGDGGGGAGAASRTGACTVPRETLVARLRKHGATSAHVRDFLASDLLEQILNDDTLRPVLAMRKCAKEVSEAFAAARQVVIEADAARAAGRSCGRDGEGLVVLDVCCGRGLSGLLLSHFLPAARIALFDNNGAMDLSHVAGRANVTFTQVDLFAAESATALDGAAGAALSGADVGACVAIGTHLCGSLSPRLIDLCLRSKWIDALVLSPCCLRGALGASVGRATRAAAPPAHRPAAHVARSSDAFASDAYVVYVHTLAALCAQQLGLLPSTIVVEAQPRAQVTGAQAGAAGIGGGGDGVDAREERGREEERIGGDADAGSFGCMECEVVAVPEEGEADALLAPGEEGGAGGAARVRVVYDAEVLSPRNGFIIARKKAMPRGPDV